MSYATLQNLKDRLGSGASPPRVYEQLTDRVNISTANDGVGQALVDDASARMDSYFGRRYTTPVDTSGNAALAAVLREYCLDIAVHHAWLSSPLRNQEPEKSRRLFDEAIKWLTLVQKGDADLPGNPAAPAASETRFTGMSVGDERVFTKEAMDGL